MLCLPYLDPEHAWDTDEADGGTGTDGSGACGAGRIRIQSTHGTRTRRTARRARRARMDRGLRPAPLAAESTPRSSVTSASSAFRIVI